MYLKLITPSGFCMGVERAISMLDDLVNNNPDKKIYCLHEIVHNPNVVDYFKNKGVVFIDDFSQIDDKDCILAFSAHGINKFTLEKTAKEYAQVVNLECPLVTKVYNEAKMFVQEGRTIFYIGKKGHQEAEQVVEFVKDLGGKVYIFLKEDEIPQLDKNEKIAIVNQTTLNYKYILDLIEKIKQKYPDTKSIGNSDICKATFDRQSALKNELDNIDLLIVIGGKNSSNTKELVKIGENAGKEVIFIQSASELENVKIDKSKKIGITAGASTPTDEIYKAGSLIKNGELKMDNGE